MTHIYHKRDIHGNVILNEMFVNNKFIFVNEYKYKKGMFTSQEQKAIELHLKNIYNG